MYQGSPDSKDLWASNHILNSILAFMGKKCNLIALGVILFVLYLGLQHSELFEDYANLYLVVHITRYCRNLFVSDLSHVKVSA